MNWIKVGVFFFFSDPAVKALCVLALNAPLLVWRLHSFPPGRLFYTHTHTRARGCYEPAFVLKGGEIQKLRRAVSVDKHILYMLDTQTGGHSQCDLVHLLHTRTHTHIHTDTHSKTPH